MTRVRWFAHDALMTLARWVPGTVVDAFTAKGIRWRWHALRFLYRLSERA